MDLWWKEEDKCWEYLVNNSAPALLIKKWMINDFLENEFWTSLLSILYMVIVGHYFWVKLFFILGRALRIWQARGPAPGLDLARGPGAAATFPTLIMCDIWSLCCKFFSFNLLLNKISVKIYICIIKCKQSFTKCFSHFTLYFTLNL